MRDHKKIKTKMKLIKNSKALLKNEVVQQSALPSE